MGEGLEVEGLRKSFGDLQALDDVSFAVRPGELFGFVGSNGAGKTTTMRIVLGVLASDDGVVRVDGTPVDAALRRRIGYMPAERGLYPKMRVEEHLVYLARLHGMSRADAAASVRRWATRLGVDHRAGDEIDTLSTGNQQRVQLAAALVHDPDVLVLDEPFSGLDPLAVDVMREVLVEKAASGVPVLFSSHQLDLVEEVCDRVGIIARGRMMAVGTVDELRADAPRRIEVHGVGASGTWASSVPGVRMVEADGRRLLLELDAHADDQAVLAAALRYGEVTSFTPVRPRLAEIYRDAVTA
jgi:ABC-2 type transport system ATP-binding protein